MDEIVDSPLGKATTYVDQYDPNVLFTINRDQNRINIGIDVQDLPFQGVDIWNGFDFTWLNKQNLPEYGMLTIYVPSDSPNLIESKSLKLYLFSFANSQFQSVNEIVATIQQDLSAAAGAPVNVTLANVLLSFMHVEAHFTGDNIDNLEISCTDYDVNPNLLTCNKKQNVTEQLCSDLLRSSCPVTGKPDWGSVRIAYTGHKINQENLLRYIISYRNHLGFHEQCIEQIYFDILNICKPKKLVVEGRYTRRGGLDINPIRANTEFEQPNYRLFRQ